MPAQKVIETASGYIPLQEFTSSMSSKVPVKDAQAAAGNTINAVRELCNPSAQNRIKLDVSSFTLISGSNSSDFKSADISGLDIVKELAQAARTTAPAHACSSVLAGHSSESDEYADIGFLLKLSPESVSGSSADSSESGVKARARIILSNLGLDSLLSSEITPLNISTETNCPVAFKASPQDADVQHLTSLLARLTHKFAFRVSTQEEVFHFLLGQVPGNDDVWAGLLGVGTWSD